MIYDRPFNSHPGSIAVYACIACTDRSARGNPPPDTLSKLQVALSGFKVTLRRFQVTLSKSQMFARGTNVRSSLPVRAPKRITESGGPAGNPPAEAERRRPIGGFL